MVAHGVFFFFFFWGGVMGLEVERNSFGRSWFLCLRASPVAPALGGCLCGV